MHPTFTQVPPTPHVYPWADGDTKSANPTFFPSYAAALELANPPEPPPITKRSYEYLNTIFIINNIFESKMNFNN